MFGSMRKKNRQPAQPLNAATANPNAASAAAAVFGRRDSNSSLSSAAAAAALRARPTTPINVGEVQTKRTQRRSASVSSPSSHHESRRGLQRTPSQGSMTERTFRSPSPSPHRQPSTAPHHDEQPPPVPSIPDDVRSDDARTSSHKKATSIQTQPFRVASQKQKDGGGGSWFGAATEGNMSSVRESDAALARVTTTKPPEPRHGAVSPSSSINFSYPRGPQAALSNAVEGTPSMTHSQPHVASRPESIASSSSEPQTLVYDPNSRRMVPKTELVPVEQAIRGASEKPIKKKKSKSQGDLGRSGSHLARGSVGRVKGTAVEREESSPKPSSPARAQAQPEPQQPPQHRVVESPEPKQLQQPPLAEEPSRAAATAPSPQPEPEESAPIEQAQEPVTKDVRVSDGATILPSAEPKEPVPVLGRQPSPVEEEEANDDDDDDLAEEEATPQTSTSDALDAVPTRWVTQPQTHLNPHSTSSAVAETTPEPSRQTPSPAPLLKQHGSVRGTREHSNSPVRNARFAFGTDHLVVKHEPPPRSLSPRKSAMKHSTSPPRGVSPSDDSSDISGVGGGVEYPTMQRRKSVRVSFDDQSTKVVGEAAQDQQTDSPVVPSPQQTRRPWFSNMGRSKKELASVDDDEDMKPRPALPMFASVREKKPREAEERPLVRPLEPPQSPHSVTPSATSPDDEVQDPVGQSNDQNVGSVLQQELTSRNEANTSRTREPLPPVVTSLEGSGYYSPSSTDSEDEHETEPFREAAAESASKDEPETTSALPMEPAREGDANDDAAMNGSTAPVVGNQSCGEVRSTSSPEPLPTISIIEPSPGVKEPEEPAQEAAAASYFDLPGGFPDEDSDERDIDEQAATQQSSQPDSSVAKQVTDTETDSQGDTPSSPTSRTPHVATIEEESESSSSSSSGASIYSDAYEDMSEAEGDGFMSLDAVLTTPVSDRASQKTFDQTINGSPKHGNREETRPVSELLPKPSQAAEGAPPPETPGDWEKAKAYWKGLTLEKRKQLEREALEEAGVQADEDTVSQPKKARKKRSKRASTTGMEAAQSEETQQADPNRIYQVKPGTRVSNSTEVATPSMRQSMRASEPQPPAQGSGSGGRLKKALRGSQTAVAEPAVEPRMRKTLRPGASDDAAAARRPQRADVAVATASGGMRKSMKQDGSQQRARPVSLPQAPTNYPAPGKNKRPTSLEGPAAGAAMASASANAHPTLRRQGSDSSESSFKRARPQRQSLGFRSSMRTTNSPERPTTAGNNKSSRFSIRSLSPAPSPSSPVPAGAGTRMSMRPTLRSESSDGSTHRMRIPGLGGWSLGKKADKRPSQKRLADSSDDEEGHNARPSAFRSRFADSSDEDEPPPLPAATASASRGMVSKRMRNSGSGGGDTAAARQQQQGPEPKPSPDLPDSNDDEEMESAPQRTPSGRVVIVDHNNQGLQRKRSGRGELMGAQNNNNNNNTAQAAGGGRSSRKGGGLLSVLRRKKSKEAGKISRPEIRESAAREGTKLERSSEELAALRANNNNNGNTVTLSSSLQQHQQQQRSSPRLQKSRVVSWPLPDEDVTNDNSNKRPSTANNAATGAPPAMTGSPKKGGFLKRRSTSYQEAGPANLGTGTLAGGVTPGFQYQGQQQQQQQLDQESVSAADGHSLADGSVKRKKFGKLRKMFRLDD